MKTSHTTPALTLTQSLLWLGGAVAAFHLALGVSGLDFLIWLYLLGLVMLARQPGARRAFYFGLAAGLLALAPHLAFFYTIFSAAAAVLWLVLAFWHGLFLMGARWALQQCPRAGPLLLVPLLWMGLEYFRSELYYLRFSWLTPAMAFSDRPLLPAALGVYGTGAVLAALAGGALLLAGRRRLLYALGVTAALAALQSGVVQPAHRSPGLRIAGVQLEFPSEQEILAGLNRAQRAHPDADLFVLSEYTLSDLPGETLRAWCRNHRKWLVVGGTEPAGEEAFYNTAFVLNPEGEVAHKQAKSVPIQFFTDGLPAPHQELWHSPWGRIGLAICYDLSYSRVIDRLVSSGAELLVIPTMDVAAWGAYQHRLHARIAPLRAAEYGIPIYRLASSGISQAVTAGGAVVATAPFPGEGALLVSTLAPAKGRLPLDRWLAPPASAAALVMLLLAVWNLRKEKTHEKTRATPPAAAVPV